MYDLREFIELKLVTIPELMQGRKVGHLSTLPPVAFLGAHSVLPNLCMPKSDDYY